MWVRVAHVWMPALIHSHACTLVNLGIFGAGVVISIQPSWTLMQLQLHSQVYLLFSFDWGVWGNSCANSRFFIFVWPGLLCIFKPDTVGLEGFTLIWKRIHFVTARAVSLNILQNAEREEKTTEFWEQSRAMIEMIKEKLEEHASQQVHIAFTLMG